ncbi:hypothetical protein [Solobacterium moorei]|uniref:hypothetical protein n=1 Tax=Solobacterium moorei TaxID=102148 RepID=UPI0023F10F0F|nr:hypothetical protein [Solobacterium moorei]
MFKYVDYYQEYGRIMQFNKNKKEPIHRWYPFVEGYSKEFIKSIIDEVNKKDLVCLEPFSGSGTTSLELQHNNIPCYSFEINPLMYIIAKVKLENDYDLNKVELWHDFIQTNRAIINADLKTVFSTLYEGDNKEKWNYDKAVGLAVQKLKTSISLVKEEKYKNLFFVVLSSILLDVSNLYRNGKCLSYKKNWKEINLSEADVFKKFDDKMDKEIKIDIQSIKKSKQNNRDILFNEDSRVGIETKVPDNSIDLVITSPPYLNSRDYTDTYMLELKTLGLTSTYEEVRNLREKTLRSHVQIKWEDNESINNKTLESTLKLLKYCSGDKEIWNSSILDMVRLYFVDMKKIFRVLYKKVKLGGRIYFNVSNSAYFNVMINTLEICAEIAESERFKVIEIRKARKLKPSPQQKEQIEHLLEGVIVMEK